MRNTQRTEKIAFSLLLLATIVVIVPVVFIVALVLFRGLPALTPEFIFAMPRDGMRAGGIFPAIVGTIYLTLGTALFHPLRNPGGDLFNEYAAKNWLTRLIELAIINLAGVPSIVYGLFGLGLFVTFLGFGASILAGIADPGDHDPAGHHYFHA